MINHDPYKVPPRPSFRRFVDSMHALYAESLPAPEHWRRVGALLPILLDDRELQIRAADWPDTRAADGKHTNHLFYQDPRYGFVINGLVKWPGATTPIHDHAHTWTAYSVLMGSERVIRYDLETEVPVGGIANLREIEKYTVQPGFVDVVAPHAPHAEIADEVRTAALIVRSERIGTFNHRMWKHTTKEHFLSPGPTAYPLALG